MTSADSAALRWLPRVAIAETTSLAVLLVNLFTAHLDAITSLLGPIHGFLYLVVIVCAFAAPIRTPGKLLAIVGQRLQRRVSSAPVGAGPGSGRSSPRRIASSIRAR